MTFYCLRFDCLKILLWQCVQKYLHLLQRPTSVKLNTERHIHSHKKTQDTLSSPAAIRNRVKGTNFDGAIVCLLSSSGAERPTLWLH